MKLSLPSAPKRFTRKQSIIFEFGSACTKVVFNGKLVFAEPTMFIWQKQTEEIWLLGMPAYRNQAKLADDFLLVKPIRRQAPANKAMLRQFLVKLLEILGIKTVLVPWKNLSVKVLLPSELSPVYLQAIKDVIISVLPQAKFVLTETVLASSPKLKAGTQFLIDLGQTTSFWMLNHGKKIMLQRYFWGQMELDRLIYRLVEEEWSSQLDVSGLDKVKRNLVKFDLINKEPNKRLVVKAKNKQTGLGHTIMLTSSSLKPVLDTWLAELIELINDFFNQLPGASSASLVDNHFWLMGGLANLDNLDHRLTKHLGLEIQSLPKPELFLINQAKDDTA